MHSAYGFTVFCILNPSLMSQTHFENYTALLCTAFLKSQMLPTLLTGRLNNLCFILWAQEITHPAGLILPRSPAQPQRAWQRWHRSGEADTVTTARPPVISTHLAEPNAVQLSAARVLDMEIWTASQNKQKSPCSTSRNSAQGTSWPAACIQFSRYYQVVSLARNSLCTQKKLKVVKSCHVVAVKHHCPSKIWCFWKLH